MFYNPLVGITKLGHLREGGTWKSALVLFTEMGFRSSHIIQLILNKISLALPARFWKTAEDGVGDLRQLFLTLHVLAGDQENDGQLLSFRVLHLRDFVGPLRRHFMCKSSQQWLSDMDGSF